MGDSQGFPRHISLPEIFVENFSAAVDYLGLLDYVNREKIGVIGICGSGGFALSAAQVDTRIKAVATASLYDMSYSARENLSKEDILAMKQQLSIQRWTDAKNGYPEYNPTFPLTPADRVPDFLSLEAAIWFEFYGVRRGHHLHARGGFTTTSNLSFMNFNLLDHVNEISPRSILLIAGDHAHSRKYSEIVYEKAIKSKELYIVKDANHIDLYDKVDRIPFDKLEAFFKDTLHLK